MIPLFSDSFQVKEQKAIFSPMVLTWVTNPFATRARIEFSFLPLASGFPVTQTGRCGNEHIHGRSARKGAASVVLLGVEMMATSSEHPACDCKDL